MVGGMTPHRAPLLLWGAVLGSFVPGALCGPPSHSLLYFYLQEPGPSQELPLYFIRGYLDDQPIARYDSLTGKMEPLVPWMEEVEKERFQVVEWVFGADLEKFSQLSHQTGGLHTWQAIWGCELREDGSKGGFFHYGYDGRDFISFDKETLRWVAAQPQAQKVKQKWEEDPGWSERNKAFLEKTCIEWLQRYLSYKNKTLKRTEPPVGRLTHKMVNDSLEVLICQAFGFYPKEIWATWTRDGDVWKNETLHRNVAPNSDGTYYVRLSIEIHPKERQRFRCHLKHEGLQEPLVLSWKEETATTWWIPVGIVAAVILGLGILFLIWFYSSWSWISCELSEDGHKPGGDQNVCDVEDFISLGQKASPSWTLDDLRAPVTKRKWEAEPKLKQLLAEPAEFHPFPVRRNFRRCSNSVSSVSQCFFYYYYYGMFTFGMLICDYIVFINYWTPS